MERRFPNAQLSSPLPGSENIRFLNFRSDALEHRGDVVLLTPPELGAATRLPILILLHGVYGCQWNWWLNGDIANTANRMLRDGSMTPMLIAMPSDGLWGDGSGYVPHRDADYERWIVDDLPACLRELFPQLDRDKFFLAGLSMGGVGALRLGMTSAVRGFPGGHDWPYWTEHVRQTLAFCTHVLAH